MSPSGTCQSGTCPDTLHHTGFIDLHRETCAPSSCSPCSLSSSLQRTQPTVKLFLSRIAIIKNPSCSASSTGPRKLSSHFALSSYGLFASLTLWRLSVSLRLLVQAWRVARLLELHDLLPCPHQTEGIGQQQRARESKN